jgi:hypothetical protein
MTETPLTARDLQDCRKDHWEALNKAITTLMIACYPETRNGRTTCD